MLLEKELSDFNSDMYLELIMEFNNGIEFGETNKFTEEEDLRTLSVDHLMNRLEKSLSVSIDKVEKMLNRNLETSDMVRLCHIGIEIANAKYGGNKRRRSADSDESSPNKRKSKEITVKTPIQSSIPIDLERRISEMEYSTHTGLPGEIDDNKKRWLVIGICLHSILSPALRKYVAPVVTNFYNSLKLSHQIDKQNFIGHLKIYGAVVIKYLNYKAINNNTKTFGNRTPYYDYKVQNAVDLSKLFLEINMARYKGFDESCDASALLGLIVNIDKFPGNVQSAAEYVRSEIRNRWSHCNFTEWNSGMYNKSLQKIEDFINLLPLNATEKSQTIGELNKWKTNGTSYLKDTTLGLELVNDIRHQIQLLVEVEKVIYKSADTEFSTVYTELIKIGKTLSWHDTRISSLENKIAIHETKLLKCKSSYDAEPLINSWNQKMKHFVKTDVVNDILDLLKVCHCVLLTGVSGMGKTLTAQNIALHLCHEQKYSIVPCSNLNDIEMRYTDAYNQVFFIDDICGRFTTNRQKIEDWMRLDEFFKPILRKGMTKILATCRTEVFLEEIFQATFELFNKSSYNLSEKYSFKDKLVIAGKYLNQDEEMLAATLRNVDFTPLMCYLCAKHEHFDINDFLNSPYDTFCKEWNRLKYLDKEKYCVLFLCVLYNGKIDEYIVDISKELDKDELRKLGDIFECCNLGRDTSRSAIKDKLNACIDTYFIKVDKEYTIIHDKMFDFLCCYFGKALITQILKFADDKLICERVQLESIKKPNSEFTIIISINDESKYIERLKKDVENGKIHWCLNNVQMRYKEYREKLLDLLKSLDYDLKKRLINIKDVTGINSYITSCLRGYEELVNFFVSEGADVDARNGWFTPLTAACRDGHLKTVEILLNKGSHINKTNVDGETPLYTACFGGHYALVELLIDRSADIYKRNNTNHSSLYVSCLSGHDNIARLLITSGVNVFECSDSLIGATCGGSVKIVETLLTKEIDVNVVDMQGRTALLIACEEGYTNIVKLLIDKKADINKVDKVGSTPLHAACYAGFNDLVQILINNLADVNMLDKYRETPLHKSCRKGYVYVIQTLLANGADTNKANRDGYTPGDLAETEGKLADINMLKILETVPLGKLERINISESHDGKCKRQSVEAEQYEWTPLYKACDRGDVETVKTLLLNRADVNMKTKNGELSLVAACQQGHGILIQMLLDKGADINQSLLTAVQRDYERTVNILLCKRGCFGDYVNTLMTLACKAGSIKTIRILLEKGADINHVDNNKNIPICIACTKGFFHIVELLIKRGSKLNYRCKDGKTPLYYACEFGFQTIAEILIVNGADVNEIYADRKALQHNNDLFHLLTEKGLVSNIPDKDGRYPLFLSIDTGFYLISEYLVQKDYHIAMLEDDRKTALISVFQSGKKELAYLLLSKGYATNLTNFNATILYYACKLGLSEKVRTHENKTDLKRVYKDGYTPFLLADIAGNDDLSAYLREQCNYTFISNWDSRYLDLGDKRYEYLFQACMNGHTEALIKKTVLSKLNINIFFGPRGRNDSIWFKQTPLCLAIRRGHKKVIELLLKYGANVNLTFENKFDLRTENVSPTIEYGYTPLFAAFQRKFDKITNILLDSGADLEQTLYDACREGYIDAVLFLIKKGADVNSCGRYCQTALYAACLGGFHTIVKFLIERGANINQLGNQINNSTCLHAACLAGNHKVVQLLVDSGASVDAVTNRSCLHTACVVGNNKIIEILIENGVDINASQSDGTTPLMVYVLKNKMDFPSEKSVCLSKFRRRFLPSTADYTHQWESCKRSQLELKYNDLTDSQYKVIQQLIKNGANIQLKDVFGRTPLSVAKETKDEKLVELLLGKEIDIDMKTNSRETLTSEAQFENNPD